MFFSVQVNSSQIRVITFARLGHGASIVRRYSFWSIERLLDLSLLVLVHRIVFVFVQVIASWWLEEFSSFSMGPMLRRVEVWNRWLESSLDNGKEERRCPLSATVIVQVVLSVDALEIFNCLESFRKQIFQTNWSAVRATGLARFLRSSPGQRVSLCWIKIEPRQLTSLLSIYLRPIWKARMLSGYTPTVLGNL